LLLTKQREQNIVHLRNRNGVPKMNVIAPRTNGKLLAPKVVGLVGSAGSGKSTAAAMLVKQGYGLCPFAKPLKDMLRVIGLEEDEINGRHKESPHPFLCGKSPRQAMQLLGTEWGREMIGEDFWVIAWAGMASGRRVVADDVRFPNEAEAIRRRDGIIIRIVRPGRQGTAHTEHMSERALLGFECDATIVNDGSIPELREKLFVAVFGVDVEPLML
jgi:hypothetical protein